MLNQIGSYNVQAVPPVLTRAVQMRATVNFTLRIKHVCTQPYAIIPIKKVEPGQCSRQLIARLPGWDPPVHCVQVFDISSPEKGGGGGVIPCFYNKIYSKRSLPANTIEKTVIRGDSFLSQLSNRPYLHFCCQRFPQSNE